MVRIQYYYIYINIYPSTYDVHVQMIFPNHVLLHIQYDNEELICLKSMFHSLCYLWVHIRSDILYGGRMVMVKTC